MESILRCAEVTARMGKSRSAIYNDMEAGLLTPSVKLSERSVGWPASEISAINAARIAGKSAVEIRGLVSRLVKARSAAAERAAA